MLTTLVAPGDHVVSVIPTYQQLYSIPKMCGANVSPLPLSPEAGTTALVRYDFDIDSRTFCEGLIRDYGVLVTPGDCFEEPKSMRIGYAYAEDPAELKAGLEKVSKYLRTLK